MHSIIHDLESPACSGNGVSDSFVALAGVSRGSATTPGETKLSRPFDVLMVPHKTVKKICCIGAGYVGKWMEVLVSWLCHIRRSKLSN